MKSLNLDNFGMHSQIAFVQNIEFRLDMLRILRLHLELFGRGV